MQFTVTGVFAGGVILSAGILPCLGLFSARTHFKRMRLASELSIPWNREQTDRFTHVITEACPLKNQWLSVRYTPESSRSPDMMLRDCY
jgi:hypothetical protein